MYEGVEHIMATKWELMLAIWTMNHLILDKLQIYYLQLFLDQPPCYQGHMILVDEMGRIAYASIEMLSYHFPVLVWPNF